MILGVIAMTVAGGLVTLTSQYNAAIGRRLGGLKATLIFMTTGAIASLAIALLTNEGVAGWASWDIKTYHLVPGVLNIASVSAVLMLVARQGAMLTTAGMFTGQVVTGLILDSTGALGVPLIHVTWLRIVSAILLIAGVIIVVVPGTLKRSPLSNRAPIQATWFLPGAMALGAVNGLMQAVNADLGLRIGVMYAVFMFLAPGAVIVAVFTLLGTNRRTTGAGKTLGFRVRHLLPGLMNVVVLSLSILLLPTTGLQVLVATKFTANLFTAAMVDLFGAFGMPRYALSARRVTGLCCLVPGVILSVFR